MRFSVDESQLRALDRQLAEAGRAFTPRLTGSILVNAARPMLTALRNNTPVGKQRRYGKGRLKRDGAGDGTYDRGGATRRDARIRQGSLTRGDEVATVVVGISKRRGRVGWRTRFTTQGTKRSRKNEFIRRTEDQTAGLVELRFAQSAQVVVSRILSRNTR